MNQNGYQRDTCRLCDSKNIDLVLPLAATPLCDAYVPAERTKDRQEIYPLDLFLCRNCGFVQLAYVVSPEIIYRDYIYVTTSSMGLTDHFSGYVERVLSRIEVREGSLVVDLGSNDGTLLRYFKERGMHVLGVEPATKIAQQATSLGIETLPEFFSKELSGQIVRDYGNAHVVTINNLFANIDDLVDLAEGVCGLLVPGGVFVIESSYLGDMINNMVFDFIYHEHLSYLSVKPLMAFFKRFDMELIDVDRVDTKGGSLRYYFQKCERAGEGVRSSKVDEIIGQEEQQGLYRVETYRDFAKRIDLVKQSLLEVLHELKAAEKKIVGYGGSATSTTLIYHLGIAELLEYIVDDNPAKHRTFSPGSHIPVLPSNTLYEQIPDCVVILAWRYSDAIIKKHQKYLEQNGLFIVPLPELNRVGNGL